MRVLFKKAVLVATMFLAFGLATSAQTMLKGKVAEENGEPIVGAAVFYDGTNTATMTDLNGEFQIPFNKGKVLKFNCFGLKEESLRTDSNNYLSVILYPDTMTLDDAVVIGYGTTSRRDLTGSVSSIKSDDITASGQKNAIGALQGRVAGLSITSQSGEPGAGFNIKIRGNNSINADTTPLVVIDGMQMNLSSSDIASSTVTGYGTSDPLSFINPNDIESIEVLKDASATAIYGANGANGVIIITTKGGVKGIDKTTVNFDASYGLSTNPSHLDLLNAQEYADYRFTKKDYGGEKTYGIDVDYDGTNDEVMDASGYQTWDWQKLMYRTAATQSYNISIASRVGGKAQLSASLGYLDQEGLVVGNDQQRYTGRVKIDHQINNKWKVGLSVNFGRTVMNGAVTSGNNGIIQMIYRRSPIQLWTPQEEDEYRSVVFDMRDLLTKASSKVTTYDRTTANGYVNYKFAENWQLRLNASGGLSNSELLEFYYANGSWGRQLNGRGTAKKVNTYNYNTSAIVEFNKTWNKTHHFDAMAGGEMTYFNSDAFSLSTYDFEDDTTGPYNLGKALSLNNPGQTIEDNSKLSFISRANYNYKQRYYLTATFRADGSSKFYAGNRVGYFPSISAAWRVAQEPWFNTALPWVSDLKLRASAGASGNDRIGNYKALSTTTTVYYAGAGAEMMGIALASSSNPDLKWETTYQYDAGFDLSLLDDRFSITADAYYKDTHDMLYQAILPAQTGFNTQYQNLGRVSNKGIEIALTSHNISNRDFSWTTNLTFDLSRNKVLDIGDSEFQLVNISGGTLQEISRVIVGQPIGIGWGYKSCGNYQLDDFIITKKGSDTGRIYPSEAVTSANYNTFNYTLKDGVTTIAGKNIVPGDRKYIDLDGDNEITTNDRTKISDSNPKFAASLGNSFTWKNWDLNIFLEGIFGRSILTEYKVWSESGISGGNSSYNLLKESWYGHWTPENGSNTYSQLSNNTNTWCSDYYVEDASFLRIKTVTLGYSLPRTLLSKAKISSLRVSLNVDNLWVFTNYSGTDPDVSTATSLFTGLDRMSYPKPRTFTFNFNIGF